LWCSGVVRVGLYAKRAIKSGEELLYNYNYPESVVKNFWEPGERPTNARSLIPVAAERIARTTGANKLTEDDGTQNREDSSQSPLPSRHTKRKRPIEESPDTSDHPGHTNINGRATGSPAETIPHVPEAGDSEYSAYETNSHESDEVFTDGLDDDELNEGLPTRAGRRPPKRGSFRGRRRANGTGKRSNVPARARNSMSRGRGGRRDGEIRQTRSASNTVAGRAVLASRESRPQRQGLMTRMQGESVSDGVMSSRLAESESSDEL
jgi:hypothetical protein